MSDERKHEARRQARDARRAIDITQSRTGSAEASRRLLELPELVGARVVLAYLATPEEIDPAPAVTALLGRGVRIAYPRVHAPGALTLHEVADAGALPLGSFGIREPRPTDPPVEPEEVDVAIVPGVAFDPTCCRLGFGGGFYDRLLPQLRPGASKIGLAFDEQLVPAGELPVEPYDFVLDAIVTPTRVLRR